MGLPPVALSKTEFDGSILHKPTKDPISDYAVRHCWLLFSFRLKIRAFNKICRYLIARITWIWGIVALMLLKCWCYMKANYISCSPKVREICSARLRATGSVPRCKTPVFIFLRSLLMWKRMAVNLKQAAGKQRTSSLSLSGELSINALKSHFHNNNTDMLLLTISTTPPPRPALGMLVRLMLRWGKQGFTWSIKISLVFNKPEWSHGPDTPSPS